MLIDDDSRRDKTNKAIEYDHEKKDEEKEVKSEEENKQEAHEEKQGQFVFFITKVLEWMYILTCEYYMTVSKI